MEKVMNKFSEVNFLDIKEDKDYIDLIEKVIGQAFLEEDIDNINLYINVILTNPDNIRNINKQYRHIDKETDVLSFPMFEKYEIEEMKNNGNYIKEPLGDIIVSIQRVKEQAEEYGHSFEREFAYMLIHGFYHLMGYDHMEEEEKKEMREKEEVVLSKLNILR
jgi:probable rRNA maturation factor